MPGLIEEFTGGERVVREHMGRTGHTWVGAMYKAEGPERLENHGMKVAPGVWAYMGKAVSALKST